MGNVGLKVVDLSGTKGNAAKCIIGSRMTLMCPGCYTLYRCSARGIMSVRTENKDCDLIVRPAVHIQCRRCSYEGNAVILDNGIAECVSILNKHGYTTELSCDGHELEHCYDSSMRYRTFIKFVPGVEWIAVPEGWSYRGQFLETYTDMPFKRAERINSLKVSLSCLEQRNRRTCRKTPCIGLIFVL